MFSMMELLSASKSAGAFVPKETSPFHDIFDPQFGLIPNQESKEAEPAPPEQASRQGTAEDLRARKHGHLRGYKPQFPTADPEQALLESDPVNSLLPETPKLEPTHMHIASDHEHEDLDDDMQIRLLESVCIRWKQWCTENMIYAFVSLS